MNSLWRIEYATKRYAGLLYFEAINAMGAIELFYNHIDEMHKDCTVNKLNLERLTLSGKVIK